VTHFASPGVPLDAPAINVQMMMMTMISRNADDTTDVCTGKEHNISIMYSVSQKYPP